MQYSTRYIFLFSAGLCLICSLVISTLAVALRDRIEQNELLEKQKNIIYASGLVEPGTKLSAEEVAEYFERLEMKMIDLDSGEYVDPVDPESVESEPVEANAAGINEIKHKIEIYHVLNEDGDISKIVFPIYGQGLWGPLYGFVAVNADGNTIEGLTYYSHKETPGLGAEVDNPRWKGLWPGREIYDDEGEVAIEVIKGQAGTPQETPNKVDGLSGATLTSRGVTNMFHFWFSDLGYRKFIENFIANEAA